MKKELIFLFFQLAAMSPFFLFAQNEVLFSVDDLNVTADEFAYVFKKNNANKHSKEDILEYLDLYKKFKLKVKAALDKKMDTIPHLKEELNTYRRQLSKNYLLDKQLQEKVIRETFERKKTEIKLAHIVFIADTREEIERAKEKLSKLKNDPELNFQDAAMKYSEDSGTKEKGGVIGYLSAPFAKGFEEVENLAYSLDEGKIGGPVLSDMGVHLIKVIDRRPALGKIELSHIFVRKPKPTANNRDKEIERKKKKIQNAYSSLQNGMSFKNATLKYSEDDKTKYNDGYLGFIETNTYENQIEEAVYSLEKFGDYTEPIESSLGWHVYMRGDRIKPQDRSYEEAKIEILSELKNTRHLDVAKASLINQIKSEAPYEKLSEWPGQFRQSIKPNFTRYDWEIPAPKKPDTLFRFGSKVYKTQIDFIRYLKRNTRERLRLGRSMNSKEAFDKLYNDFVTESAIEYEESQLEDKYSEFRHLMREYREGILLFELTKEKVWDKAPQDTAGLLSFFDKNRENYRWNDRAKLLSFQMKAESPKDCEKATRMLMRKGLKKTIEKMNADSTRLTYSSEILEKGKTNQSISWQENVLFDVQESENECAFKWIKEIIPAENKSFKEAKGYVISDYQNELEKKWVTDLQRRYNIKTNKKTLKNLIKELGKKHD